MPPTLNSPFQECPYCHFTWVTRACNSSLHQNGTAWGQSRKFLAEMWASQFCSVTDCTFFQMASSPSEYTAVSAVHIRQPRTPVSACSPTCTPTLFFSVGLGTASVTAGVVQEHNSRDLMKRDFPTIMFMGCNYTIPVGVIYPWQRWLG